MAFNIQAFKQSASMQWMGKFLPLIKVDDKLV